MKKKDLAGLKYLSINFLQNKIKNNKKSYKKLIAYKITLKGL